MVEKLKIFPRILGILIPPYDLLTLLCEPRDDQE